VNSHKPSKYKFGDFTLNTVERTVLEGDTQLDVPSKTFDVLWLLIRKHGETLAKEELMELIWGDSFVEEGNLTVHISKLRKLLKANKTNPFIKTVHGVGYQFVEIVEEAFYDTERYTAMPTDLQIHTTNPRNLDSIAVLPLKNENGDEEIDYLADGLTESLINSLSYMPDFRVLARDTVFRYKNKDVNVQELGNKLGVATILTGRLRVIKESLVIGVELINVSDGTQIWGTQINQPFSNIFKMQEKITFAISESLVAKTHEVVTDSLPQEFIQNTESYRLYLKGNHFLENKTREHLAAAVKYFHESISIDPVNSLSYVGVGECYFWSLTYRFMTTYEALPLIRKSISTAREINSEVPALYVLIGNVSRNFEWDFRNAETSYKRALSIHPNHIEALRSYSHLLALKGKFSEALTLIGKLKKLDPISTLLSTSAGRLFYNCGQHENAIIELKEAIELKPRNFVAHSLLALAYVELGNHEKAIESLNYSLNIQHHVEAEAAIAYTHARAGQMSKARELLDRLRGKPKSTYTSQTHFAVIHGVIGEIDKAFECLENAYKEKDEELAVLKIDPRWAPLRDDPRFNDLLRRIGLPTD